MSTIRVAKIETENDTTDLTITTGNTSGPQITIYAGNGEISFTSVSGMTFGGNNISYTGNVAYSGSNVYFNATNVTFNGNSTFTSANISGDVTYSGNATYTGSAVYTGNADFSSANVTGISSGITTGKAIAMAIVFG